YSCRRAGHGRALVDPRLRFRQSASPHERGREFVGLQIGDVPPSFRGVVPDLFCRRRNAVLLARGESLSLAGQRLAAQHAGAIQQTIRTSRTRSLRLGRPRVPLQAHQAHHHPHLLSFLDHWIATRLNYGANILDLVTMGVGVLIVSGCAVALRWSAETSRANARRVFKIRSWPPGNSITAVRSNWRCCYVKSTTCATALSARSPA